MQRGREHPRLVGRSLGWSAWIAVLVLVVAGAAAAEVFCHEEHTVDERCGVCQTPPQPATDLSGSLQIGFADAANPLEQACDAVQHVHGMTPTGGGSRAPPA